MSLKRVLASMSVVLGSDTKGFEQGMKKGKSELKEFADKAKGMAKVAVAAFGAVTTAAIVAANKAAEYADEIDKTAISTGLQRDTLQKLSYVADQAGVQFSTLASSMSKLNRTMGDAAYGNKRQVESFEKLGVSIYDAEGNMKSMERMFPEVVSALNAMDNETERNALAMDLFGRSAAEVVPRLAALGDDGIKKLSEKAEKLHLVMSDQGVAALVKYKDDMSTLKQQMGAMVREAIIPFASAFTERLLPVMSGYLQKLSEWQSKRFAEKLQKEHSELNTLVTTLISANDNERVRSTLITEIKDKYPDFLKGLSDEEISVKKLRDRLKEANAQYVERIKLLALERRAQDVLGEGIDLQDKEIDLAKHLAHAGKGGDFGYRLPMSAPVWDIADGKRTLTTDMNKLAEYFSQLEADEATIQNFGGAPEGYIEGLRKLGESYLQIQLEIEDNARRHAELITKSQEISESLNELITESGDLTGSGSGSTSTGSDPASNPDPTSTASPGKIDYSKVTAISTIDPILNDSIKKLDEFSTKLDDVTVRVLDFSNAISDAFGSMAYGIAESLGHAISGIGGYEDILWSIADGFGRFAQQMGALIIAYGVAMEGFLGAIESPYVAIAAGAALVAIGTVIRDMAASPNVSGGGVSSSAAAGNYYQGSTAASGAQRIELVWRRAGPDLVAYIDANRNELQQMYKR